jgi:hypothetical protein
VQLGAVRRWKGHETANILDPPGSHTTVRNAVKQITIEVVHGKQRGDFRGGLIPESPGVSPENPVDTDDTKSDWTRHRHDTEGM